MTVVGAVRSFLFLFASLTQSQAVDGASRLLDRTRQMEIVFKQIAIRGTVSIGLAEHCQGKCFLEALERADAALYQAKAAGRDRLVLAQGGLTLATPPHSAVRLLYPSEGRPWPPLGRPADWGASHVHRSAPVGRALCRPHPRHRHCVPGYVPSPPCVRSPAWP